MKKMKSQRKLCLLCVFVVFGVTAQVHAATRLNQVHTMIKGDVWSYRVSPDGLRVVYCADQDIDDVYELYSVSSGGGISVKLNAQLVEGGDVTSIFGISPDGNDVVYRADQDIDGVFELYRVPIQGGTVTKLNNTFIPEGDVTGIWISPDSSRVVYKADQDTDNVDELYSVPLAGGSVTKLNDTLFTGGVSEIMISSDSSCVVYKAYEDNGWSLYSVPLTGGTAVRLDGALPSGRSVYGYTISPDSSRVVYRANQDTQNVTEIYSVPLEGGTQTKLNGILALGGSVLKNPIISFDSSRVVYTADQDADGVNELYSVPITGGIVTKISGALVSGGSVDSESVAISPDSVCVLYIADQDTDNVNEIYSVPIGGGTVTKLSGVLVSGGDVKEFNISPDGNRVVYRADRSTDDLYELYSVLITGGTITKLNGLLGADADVISFEISSDSNRVVYQADRNTDELYEVYSVAITGGTYVNLNGLLVNGGEVVGHEITLDSRRVIYRADKETDDQTELYSVLLEGGSSIRLNSDLAVGGKVRDFVISPDNTRVVYDSEQSHNDSYLFSVPASGGVCTTLDESFAGGLGLLGLSEIVKYEISSDSSRVVYHADVSDGSTELYSIPLGGGTPVQISTDFDFNMPPGGSRLSPDSSRVIYQIGAQYLGTTFEIHGNSIDGGTPVLLKDQSILPGGTYLPEITPDSTHLVFMLNTGTVSSDLYSTPITGGVLTKLNDTQHSIDWDYTISPDSSRVVYMAYLRDTPFVSELYSVPLTGGSNVKLNGTLTSGGSVLDYKVSPTSSRIVYRADQDTDEVDELYSVPMSGGARTKLNGALVSGGDVSRHYEINANGTYVIYIADQDTDGIDELYRVPISGGTPVKLNGALAGGGQVTDFKLTPNGLRAIYRADQDTDGIFELYSVLLGSAVRIKLNGTFGPLQDVDDNFQVSSDSTRVVYLANPPDSSRLELFSVSSGGASRVKISEPLISGEGDVQDFKISPDSSLVVFRADQETSGVVDLFSVPIGGGADITVNVSDSPDPVLPGQNYTYTITVGNQGSESATSVEVVDTLPADVTFVSCSRSYTRNGRDVICALGGMNADAEITYTITANVPEGTPPGSLQNSVAVTCTEEDITPRNDTASCSTMVGAIVDLVVSKTDNPDPAVAGNNLTYTITVENQGTAAATGVVATDTLPSGVTFVSCSRSYTRDGQDVICALGTMNADAEIIYTITVAVPADTPSGTLQNSVVATLGSGTDVNPGDNTASCSTAVTALPDLIVSKIDNPDPVQAGGTLTYTITVENRGAVAATGVVATDTLPSEFTFVSCSRGYTRDGQDVICALGTMNPDAEITYTITVTVAPGTTAGFIDNTVVATSSQGDVTPWNNSGSCTTRVQAPADLGVTKTAPAGSVLAGDDLIYTITVTNSYSTEAEWIVVTDTLPTGTVYKSSSIMGMEMMGSVEFYLETSLAAYASTSFTMTVEVKLDAPDVLTNVVTVASNGFDVNPSDNMDQHITLVAYPPLVEETTPGDAAASTADIVVIFNTAINPSTVDTASFRVQGLLNGPYVGTFTIVGSTVTFNPTQDFLPGDTITCSLTADMESAVGLPIHPHLFQFRASVPYGMDAPLTDSGQMLGQNMSYAVALGDLDRDGDLDAFVANGEDMMMMGGGAADKLWLNNGSGVFIDSGLNLGTNVSRCVALGDLDGDGDQDVLIGAGMNSDGTPAPNRVLLNNLPNTFTFTPTGAIVSDSICYDVALGDLDGDGDLDIFEANGPDMMMTTMGENRVLFNDGSGTFTDSGQLLGFADSRSVTLGDLDGDGDLDAVVGNYNEDSVVMINDGQGYFSENMLMDMSGPGGSQSVGVELGDLDGDSDLDLWLASESGGSTWTNSGNGYLEKSQSLGGSENFITVALGDLDADGDLDAVTPNYNFEMDTFFAWRNAGGTFSNRTDNPSLSMPYDATLGDLNGDGTLDLFIAEDGANTVWFGQLPAALDLGIAKSASPYTVTNSNALSYTITVSNLSASAASGVVVVDTLPDSVAFGSSLPPADSVVDGICTYNLGALGASSLTSIVMQVTVADTTVGAITNSATVSHSGPDGNAANDLAECVVNVNDNDSDGDPDFHDPDDDNDTLPDIWESGYSLDPLSAADASGNPDLDPYVNTEEYILDYNPNVSNGWFRIIGVTNRTVYFNSSANRNYTLRGCSNLVDGLWFDVPNCGPRLGIGGADSLHDSSDAEPIFYKVRVELP